jgi:hypothetical protein
MKGGASTRLRRRQAGKKLSVRDKQQIGAAAQRTPQVRVKDVARCFGVSVGAVYKQVGAVAPEK